MTTNTHCHSSALSKRARVAATLPFCALAMAMWLPNCVLAADKAITEFFGMDSTDGLVRITYEDVSAPWTGGSAIYGAVDRKEIRYCWTEYAAVTEASAGADVAGNLDRTPLAFNCTSARGAKPTVQFLPVDADAEDAEASDSASSKTVSSKPVSSTSMFARIAKQAKLAADTLKRTYICKIGCGPAIPLYLFEVAVTDPEGISATPATQEVR